MLTEEQVAFQINTLGYAKWSCDTCGHKSTELLDMWNHIINTHEEGNATEIERMV